MSSGGERPPSLVRDSLLLVPSYLVPGIVSLASVPVLFALLGATQYGQWALIFAIGNGVPQLTTSWLEATTLRFGHRRSSLSRSGLTAAALVLSSAMGAVMSMVFIPEATWVTVATTAVFTASVGAYLIAVATLQSRLRFGLVSSAAAVRSLLGGAVGILLAALTHSAGAAILGLTTGFALAAAKAALGPRRVDDNRSSTDPGVENTAYVRYGAASIAFALALMLLNMADRLILAAYRPLADVGIYAATYTIVDLLLRMPPSVVVTAIRPRLFQSWDRRVDWRAGMIPDVARAMLWVSGALTLALVLIGPSLSFLPLDAQLVGPLCIGIAAFGVANTLGLLYSAQERQGRLALSAVAAATLNILLNLALVPRVGLMGAAIATALSYLAYLAANLPASGRSGWSPRTGLVFGACMAATGAAAIAADPRLWPWATISAIGLLASVGPSVASGGRRVLVGRS